MRHHANVAHVALVTWATFACTCAVGCGPANSGSRSNTLVPWNAFGVRGITVMPPADAKAHELAWLRETTQEHLAVCDLLGIDTHMSIGVRFHRTLADVQRAHQAAGGLPTWWQPSVAPGGQNFGAKGPGFLEGRILHVAMGSSLESPGLAHHLMHVYMYQGVTAGQHLDPLWTRVDFEDWIVSLRLAGQR